MRAGSPPKNAAAATWAATHSVWSMTRVGRTKRGRLADSTITNAHRGRRRPPLGVEPHPEPAVVHLGLLPRRWVVLQHRHPVGPGFARQGHGHVAAKRRLAGGEAVLVTQALVDRGEVVGGQCLLDGLVMAGAL